MLTYQTIQSNASALAAATSADWAACSAALIAKSITVKDDTLRSARWLMLALTGIVDPVTGMNEADVVLGTLQGSSIPRVKAAYDSLCSDGLDLANDQIQAMLPVLASAGKWPAGLLEKVASGGVWLESTAQRAGLTDIQCDAASCESVWTKFTLEALADSAYQAFVDKYNSLKSGISAGTVTTPEQVAGALA